MANEQRTSTVGEELATEAAQTKIEKLATRTFEVPAVVDPDLIPERAHVPVEMKNALSEVESRFTLEEIDGAIRQWTAEKNRVAKELEYWTTLRSKVDTEVEKVKPA